MSESGQFFIVNVGAGEHDNITLKGWRLLQRADLVIASKGQRERFAEALKDKEVIDGGHGLFTEMALRRLSPDEVEQQQTAMRDKLNTAHAAGKTIVLIESGDMALFSPYRGYLSAFRHLDPMLVPGVSSFNAANAALRQPVLDERSQRLQLSGLEAIMQADKSCLPDTWVLFCMGLDLPALVRKIRTLYPGKTNVGIILNAGYPDCEVIRCKVETLDTIAQREVSVPVCIIYIGLKEYLPEQTITA